jgi:hypothetical protein
MFTGVSESVVNDWEAVVLPLNYARETPIFPAISCISTRKLVRGLSGASARPALAANVGQVCTICRWGGLSITRHR